MSCIPVPAKNRSAFRVCADSPRATGAATEILEQGGNAIDAALAAWTALAGEASAVTALLLFGADGEVRAFDGRCPGPWPVERAHIHVAFRGLEVVSTAGGLELLVALRLLERLRPATLADPSAAAALAVHGAFRARELYPVEPDQMTQALVRYLVGDERIDLLARTLQRGVPTLIPDAGDPRGTTHVVVADGDGNVASLTDAGASPALVVGASGPVLALAVPGDRRMTASLVQLISAAVDGDDVLEAKGRAGNEFNRSRFSPGPPVFLRVPSNT